MFICQPGGIFTKKQNTKQQTDRCKQVLTFTDRDTIKNVSYILLLHCPRQLLLYKCARGGQHWQGHLLKCLDVEGFDIEIHLLRHLFHSSA